MRESSTRRLIASNRHQKTRFQNERWLRVKMRPTKRVYVRSMQPTTELPCLLQKRPSTATVDLKMMPHVCMCLHVWMYVLLLLHVLLLEGDAKISQPPAIIGLGSSYSSRCRGTTPRRPDSDNKRPVLTSQQQQQQQPFSLPSSAS